ncbi:MAG: GDSL-type esterase/lipase family protein [Acidimicrobiia bacterium]
MVPRLLIRGVTAGAVVLGAEAAYAVLRPAAKQTEFDPSGVFGEPHLPPMRVAVLGDSSVTAPGVAGPEEIWVSRVGAHLGETRHVTLRSFAVSGSRAIDLTNNQLEPALVFDPDLVIVSVGANDALKGVSVRTFEGQLDELIGALADVGALILMSGVGDLGTIPRLYPPLRNMMSRRSARFDRAHHLVAERYGAHVIEHRSDNPTVWYSDRSLWSADLFHVSAAGHERWANVTWRTLQPLIDARHGSG